MVFTLEKINKAIKKGDLGLLHKEESDDDEEQGMKCASENCDLFDDKSQKMVKDNCCGCEAEIFFHEACISFNSCRNEECSAVFCIDCSLNETKGQTRHVLRCNDCDKLYCNAIDCFSGLVVHNKDSSISCLDCSDPQQKCEQEGCDCCFKTEIVETNSKKRKEVPSEENNDNNNKKAKTLPPASPEY